MEENGIGCVSEKGLTKQIWVRDASLPRYAGTAKLWGRSGAREGSEWNVWCDFKVLVVEAATCEEDGRGCGEKKNAYTWKADSSVRCSR
eukprot:jgi/Picsp_1/2338/NSC_05801-R1_---NA---